MNIDQEFPKRYITSGDVDAAGGPVRLRVVDVVVESIGAGNRAQRKPALVFHGTRKVLALNASNLQVMRSHLGPETAAWIGAVVTLECVDDKFENRPVRSVRVLAVVAPQLSQGNMAKRAPSQAGLELVGDEFVPSPRDAVKEAFPTSGLGNGNGRTTWID